MSEFRLQNRQAVLQSHYQVVKRTLGTLCIVWNGCHLGWLGLVSLRQRGGIIFSEVRLQTLLALADQYHGLLKERSFPTGWITMYSKVISDINSKS